MPNDNIHVVSNVLSAGYTTSSSNENLVIGYDSVASWSYYTPGSMFWYSSQVREIPTPDNRKGGEGDA